MSGLHELVRRLDELRQRDDRPRLVAVDGRSGVGKSTLVAELALRCGGAVICADDFYAGGSDTHWLSLPPATRAAAVIDWRRLRTTVLEPLLSAGRPPGDHSTSRGGMVSAPARSRSPRCP